MELETMRCMIELEYDTDGLELKTREKEKLLYRGAFDLGSARRNHPVGYSMDADGVILPILTVQALSTPIGEINELHELFSYCFYEFCFI